MQEDTSVSHHDGSDRLAVMPQCLCEISKENCRETLPWFGVGQVDTLKVAELQLSLVTTHEAWLPVSWAQCLETVRYLLVSGSMETWRMSVYLMWGKCAVGTLIDTSLNLMQTSHKSTTAADLPCRGCQRPFSVRQRSTRKQQRESIAAWHPDMEGGICFCFHPLFP